MSFVIECGSEVVSVPTLDEVASTIPNYMKGDEPIRVTEGGEPLSLDQKSYIKSLL